jgi:hypothetical protein
MLMLLLSSLLQSFLVKGEDEMVPTEDEFEEVSAQSLPSQLDEPAAGGDKEFYKSLSIYEKLHYQLRKSGDLSGKYSFTL